VGKRLRFKKKSSESCEEERKPAESEETNLPKSKVRVRPNQEGRRGNRRAVKNSQEKFGQGDLAQNHNKKRDRKVFSGQSVAT